MYKLINEIGDSIKVVDYLVEAIKEIFEGEEKELLESAENYLGKAIGALNAGNNPFEGENPMLDPHVVASLVLLSSPENREAFNFTPAKFTVLDHVDKSEKVRTFLQQKVGMSASGRKAAENLMQVASENPKQAARMLSKAQMAFTGVVNRMATAA